MTTKHRMDGWLRVLGARPNGRRYTLDGFSPDFYLVFDAGEDPDTPEAEGSVDVLMGNPGRPGNDEIRILVNAWETAVCRLLFALGPSRFQESVRSVLYARAANVLRKDGG